MCELFAVSSRAPAAVNFSFHTFAQRGGEVGPHADGWGLAWYEGADVNLLREPEAAARSALVRFLEGRAFHSRVLVSHIRRATQGPRSLANTQPFVRELGGRMHLFAHNGDLHGIADDPGLAAGRFRPVGDTDSEQAFCALLGELQDLWDAAPPGGLPPFEARFEAVGRFAARAAPLGPANFIYSDGDVLFAHGNRRTQDCGDVGPPGLWVLCAECEVGRRDMDGVSVRTVERAPEILLVASRPLTLEGWMALGEGEVVAARDGVLVARQVPG